MDFFGALIIGPSGSGKSTLCAGLSQFFTSLKRPHKLINLDPANEDMKYKCDIDIRELVKVDEVMDQLKLGPNGALVFLFRFY